MLKSKLKQDRVVGCFFFFFHFYDADTSHHVRADANQSRIPSPPHAEHSLCSSGTMRWDESQNLWRSEAFATHNAGFSPFHALVLTIVGELSQLHWPPERPRFFTSTKCSFCYYHAITVSDAISPLPVVNTKCFAPSVILSLVVRAVDCFVCENCGDCAEIPSADGRRH